MKIKKYIGKTMPEIMQQIRQDLGPDAVILKTNEIMHGGFMGLFKKKKLEVVAALDPQPIEDSPPKVTPPFFQEKEEKDFQYRDDLIMEELQQLKTLVHTQVKSNVDFSPNYLLTYNYLIDQEVDPKTAKQLIEDIKTENHSDASLNEITNSLTQYLIEKLKRNIPNHREKPAKIIHFIGPTGVGKTTTLAKIASDYILTNNKRIAFVTTDTYRIAAIDQLKTYAKILNVPVEVAYTKADYQQAIKQFSDYDYIFVDTAGRNFREDQFIKDLKNTIDLYEEHTTYLVLSLTAKPRDIMDIFNRFYQLNIDRIIFTKIDETNQFGSILNIALNHDVKIGYLTNGQDVPQDILRPTEKMISNLVLGEITNE